MDIRIIKTKQRYRRYLEEVDRLVALDPDPRTVEGASSASLAGRKERRNGQGLALLDGWQGNASRGAIGVPTSPVSYLHR